MRIEGNQVGRIGSLIGACGLAIFLHSTAHADKLSPADLARKNEGGYFTGLPLAGFSTDIGFGAGARVYYFWNGHRSDARFSTTPYVHRVFLQAFASTGGIQFHWLDYDAPNLLSTPYRVRSQIIFARNTNQNYFGLGDQALRPLQFRGSAQTFDSYSTYTDAQRRISDGTTWAKYDQLDLLRPIAIGSVERLFLGNRVRILGGLGVTYTRIRDYTGRQVDARDDAGNATSAVMNRTRLREDCDAGKLLGCGGGRDNYLRLGVSYDTRDYEPDPNRGVFIDLALDISTIALGSEFNYRRFLAAARGYWSPIPRLADLTVAGRAVFQVQSDETPFFSLNVLPFTEDTRTGLGGHRSLRGFRQDRFVGRTMALLNGELRWTFARVLVWRQRLAVIAVPFVDMGRPFDSSADVSLRRWRKSYGGALRVSWNLATIVTADYGRSDEDTGFYLNFNHMF